MQISSDQSQLSPQKVKNILTRCFRKERHESYLYNPEASHILKYAPKYYQTLAIEIKPFNPLLSKIKKIKKLKKLEGETEMSFNPFTLALSFWTIGVSHLGCAVVGIILIVNDTIKFNDNLDLSDEKDPKRFCEKFDALRAGENIP